MYHRRPLPPDLVAVPGVTTIQADLGNPRTLPAAVRGIDVVVHFKLRPLEELEPPKRPLASRRIP